MLRVALIALSLILPAAAWAGGPIQPPGPQAKPACSGGNSVLGYTSYGSPLVCGTALASGSIANGVSQLGVYIGTNTIGPLTPSGDVAFSSPNFTVNSARGGNITIPNVTDTVALLAAAQTLTNKTVNCANNTCTVRANLDLTGILAAANFPAQTGDVTNSAGSLATTVVQLQGRPLASTAPTSGQIISWNGSTWLPVTAPISGINALTQDVTASGFGSQAATVVGFQSRPFASTAPTSGQIISWNGSTWLPVTAPTSGINALTQDVTASGTGSQAATVVGFQGRPFASTAPTTNQVVTWNGSTWGPATPAAGGITQITGDAAAGPGTGSQAITLATTGVSAGSYQLGSYCATYDAKGRATNIVLATCGGGGGNAFLIQTGSKFLVQTGSVFLIQ